MSQDLDTGQIKSWQSILVLIVFVITSASEKSQEYHNRQICRILTRPDIIVLFPFHVPILLPRTFCNGVCGTLRTLRIIPPRPRDSNDDKTATSSRWVRLRFPVDMITAPLIADLLLLATTAIGRQEVYDGTIGTDHIYPIEVMAFFITLAYIAISLDASGLIRFLACWVLAKAGKSGHLLFFYLYSFFFALACVIGNDPIVLSGTPFLAYMTAMSANIENPRAWIYTQFAVANVGSAILVSSNPTNLVLAGAFDVKFIDYTANVVVPVVVTTVCLFPFLLYLVFRKEALIPRAIQLHELSEEQLRKKPRNPNIPHLEPEQEKRKQEEEEQVDGEQGLSLEEIMNPYLDKVSAAVGAVIMIATLITVLAINAASSNGPAPPAYWVTCPAAFVMFCFDVTWGWLHRHESREVARQGEEENGLERTRSQYTEDLIAAPGFVRSDSQYSQRTQRPNLEATRGVSVGEKGAEISPSDSETSKFSADVEAGARPKRHIPLETAIADYMSEQPTGLIPDSPVPLEANEKAPPPTTAITAPSTTTAKSNLVDLSKAYWTSLRETLPTTTTVVRH